MIDITPLILFGILAIAGAWSHFVEKKPNVKRNQKKTKFTETDGRFDFENGITYRGKGQAYARGFYEKYTDKDLKEVLKNEKRRNNQSA